MSTELSAEEKKRILRERRQAKMSGGKASSRLNTILSQGSSVNSEATSVLDKTTDETKETQKISPTVEEGLNAESNDVFGLVDRSALLNKQSSPVAEKLDNNAEDMDQLFKQILSQNSQENGSNDQNDVLSLLMRNLLDPNQANTAAPGADSKSSEKEDEYERQLVEYKKYQQSKVKFIFLVLRYLAIFINFTYHYLTSEGDSFKSSSYAHFRLNAPATIQKSFITYFITFETVILGTYFVLLSRLEALKGVTESGIILKGLSLVSLVAPKVEHYRPLITSLLNYAELLWMLIADVSLIVVIFGVISGF